MLWLIVAIGLAPIVASYAAYYWFTPSKRVNYGELLETAFHHLSPLPEGCETRTGGNHGLGVTVDSE